MEHKLLILNTLKLIKTKCCNVKSFSRYKVSLKEICGQPYLMDKAKHSSTNLHQFCSVQNHRINSNIQYVTSLIPELLNSRVFIHHHHRHQQQQQQQQRRSVKRTMVTLRSFLRVGSPLVFSLIAIQFNTFIAFISSFISSHHLFGLPLPHCPTGFKLFSV